MLRDTQKFGVSLSKNHYSLKIITLQNITIPKMNEIVNIFFDFSETHKVFCYIFALQSNFIN